MAFFFQAEDGIRDVAVTGVQTCALPICVPDPRRRSVRPRGAVAGGGAAAAPSARRRRAFAPRERGAGSGARPRLRGAGTALRGRGHGGRAAGNDLPRLPKSRRGVDTHRAGECTVIPPLARTY